MSKRMPLSSNPSLDFSARDNHRGAVSDVDRLLRLPTSRQVSRIRHYRSRLLNRLAVEELLNRALILGPKDPNEASRLCGLAWEICLWISSRKELPGGEPELNDLRALVLAHRGNAARILCCWQTAREKFCAAYHFLNGGSGDVLLSAFVWNLHASLLRDCQEYDEALDTLSRAIQSYRCLQQLHLLGRVLLNRASVFRSQGHLQAALQDHMDACHYLDENKEPFVAGAAWLNLAVLLCDQERYRDALSVLDSGPDLREICGEDSSILLNRIWIEGMVHCGLTDYERAERLFFQAHDEFCRRDDPYNAGLVGLDLAITCAAQGRIGDLEEVAVQAFERLRSQKLHEDARQALGLFLEAVRQRQAVSALQAAVCAVRHAVNRTAQ